MVLKYATLASDIDLAFFTSLASNKIDHDRLDDSARRVLGLYEIRPSDSPEGSCRLQLHANALSTDSVPRGFYRAEGLIRNVNTMEEYKSLDKPAFLQQVGKTIWASILDGTIYSFPSLLASFAIVCFADLKKYRFTYQFGFPALHSEPPWRHGNGETELDDHSNEVIERLQKEESSSLVEAVQTWRYQVDARQYGFFLAKKTPKSESNRGESLRESRQGTSASAEAHQGCQWSIGSLSEFEQGFFHGIEPADQFICFSDPSNYTQYPGWMLRNLLILVGRRWQLQRVQILCYRDIQSHRDDARSTILKLVRDLSDAGSDEPIPKITGWERNNDGKLASKVANLGDYMDPYRLADQAVDLNLKLIKWRISPGLDLDTIKGTKCLLLGAGTLGTYVARNLMGWGVRKITFVDNGSVSFSNPVRQPLFTFNDCLAGGSKKAVRASEALTEIYPGVETQGHVLSVPMLGHPIMDETKTRQDFESLHQLIEEHDAILLLMDSRESRWLPTVMGKAAGKVVMNAALGFDTFLVMRHGSRKSDSDQDRLGCYFCNDVVAPADSLSDRTLDQQCTVTRPGVAPIASALLVELLVSLIQCGTNGRADSSSSDQQDRGEHPLGIVPHQIRGFLPNFENILVKGQNYDCCSACSPTILSTYDADGWHFVKRALNEKHYIEELSGLAEVQRQAEQAMESIDSWDEEDEEGDVEII